MAKNKVIYNGETLIDLTNDTVTADSLLEGYTAHNAAGAEIIGTLVLPTSTISAFGKPGSTVLLDDESMTEEAFNAFYSKYTAKAVNGTYILSWADETTTYSKPLTVDGNTSTVLVYDTISENTWEMIEWASLCGLIPDTWNVGNYAPDVVIDSISYPTRVIDIRHAGKGAITFEFCNAIGSAVNGCESVADTYKGNLPTSAVMELPTDTELGAYTKSGSLPFGGSGTIYAYYALNSQTAVLSKTLKSGTKAAWWAGNTSKVSGGNSTQYMQCLITTDGYGSSQTYKVEHSGGSSTVYSAYISPIFYFA